MSWSRKERARETAQVKALQGTKSITIYLTPKPEYGGHQWLRS